ncbi:peptidoglycan editing factor PgeF [Colwelliaceae bacterium 6441]
MNSQTINNAFFREKKSAFDDVALPVETIQAFQTTRLSPVKIAQDQLLLDQNAQKMAPFDEFNLGLHVGDEAIQVSKNRQCLLSYLPQHSSIQWLEQVHGSNVVILDKISDVPLQADAIITRVPKLALAIMTADCLPILLANKVGTEIAAIHAGWRPLSAGIIDETLTKMLTDNKDIYAWLGPCITQAYFEVGNEVKTQFEQLNPGFSVAFKANKKGKWLADLQQIAVMMLTQHGVTHISLNSGCTYSMNERYYSYRKAHTTGRMAAIICIK